MTESKSGRKSAKKPVAAGRFTVEERAAMQEHARELKATRRGAPGNKANAESEVLAKIAAMPDPDRSIGERLHAIIKSSAPSLSPKLWYGMPAYANEDGQVVCFFQNAHKFKTRYGTLGFSDKAHLDEGQMWPTSYALMELKKDEEARICALVKRAVR